MHEILRHFLWNLVIWPSQRTRSRPVFIPAFPVALLIYAFLFQWKRHQSASSVCSSYQQSTRIAGSETKWTALHFLQARQLLCKHRLCSQKWSKAAFSFQYQALDTKTKLKEKKKNRSKVGGTRSQADDSRPPKKSNTLVHVSIGKQTRRLQDSKTSTFTHLEGFGMGTANAWWCGEAFCGFWQPNPSGLWAVTSNF